MIVFAKVVDAGGFSAAAREMSLSPSAVSKQIHSLEDRLGVRLLNRSTRKISLTEEGRAFYERSREIASDVDEAEALVTSMGMWPQGTLRVASTVAFGKRQLLPLLPAFLDQYKDVRCVFELSDRPVDLVSGDVDVAIRFTEQISDDGVIARKLAHNTRIYCAAPCYLARHPEPKAPAELTEHNCLGLTTVSRWNNWTFGSGETTQKYRVSGNFVANSADGIYHAALAGIGIARLSTYLVNDDIRAGRLIRILPEYADHGSDLFAIYLERRHLSPKTRAFIDMLSEHFGDVPPWERTDG
ncbi:MAG: LysR family transcriptional regulator [Rhodospirillales bacterium]